MNIPIQNIYYLLCYAWDKLEEKEVVDVDPIESTSLVASSSVLETSTLILDLSEFVMVGQNSR